MDTKWSISQVFAVALIGAGLASPVVAAPMSEELRAEVSRIVILPVPGESNESITGTYGRETDGFAGGAAKGAEMGQVPVEAGPVPISIPIPILRELGMLWGSIRGGADRMKQDLRDRMSEDLATAVDQPLSNISLATDVFWALNEIATVDPKLFATTTPVPTDTHAILYVHIDEVTLNIQEDVAIVTTTATARLQDYTDGKTLYRQQVSYADQDKLRNWARNDYVLWREYREFARHYLGRELVDELYERIYLDHSLEPVFGNDIKPDKQLPWRGSTKALNPTLDWEFALQGEAEQQGPPVSWDLEIYDAQKPVYRAQRIPGTEFTLDVPLEACKTYWWSVRPTYQRDGRDRHGVWMRRPTAANQGSFGNQGRAISEAHAYLQDFAVLDVNCKAR
jgi:hypothetical protein